jgi:basic amino acid/polyamine antiporter, APA family
MQPPAPGIPGLHPEESSGVHHTLMGIIMSGIVVTNGNLDWFATLFNFGTLLTFFFINLSLLKLRKMMTDARRSFKIPLYPYTPIFAMIGCIILACYLNPNAVLLLPSF